MAFSPIRTATDASQFAGAVVAYYSCSTYFSSGTAIAEEQVQYGIISEESSTWRETEKGHYLCKLHMWHEKESEANRALIDSRLKEANLEMRRADEGQIGFMKNCIVCNWGYFESMTDKNKVLQILQRQFPTTPSGEA